VQPGITIAHANELTRDAAALRGDVAGFIAVVPRARWWKGARRGDFCELAVEGLSEFARSPGRSYFDPVTQRAVKAFFQNGGLTARIFGLCVESMDDLMCEDPFADLFIDLIERLRSEEDVALLLMPALAYMPVEMGQRGRVVVRAQPVIELLLSHCREMNNRFLILDAPRDLHDKMLMRWVSALREANEETSAFGAIYYPWLMNGDEVFPPSGTMAGVFAKVENEHNPGGVRWPPANIVLEHVTHPAIALSWRETGDYSEAGINPILVQNTRGVVVWGARTLSRDPRWLHINARRITSFIAEQIRRDSEWVVFEHQRPELWSIIERMVTARLDAMWGAGLLTGDRAGNEYHVQCDAEVNPPEVRDAGQVHCRVMLKPIGTAEFVVVELRLG